MFSWWHPEWYMVQAQKWLEYDCASNDLNIGYFNIIKNDINTLNIP